MAPDVDNEAAAECERLRVEVDERERELERLVELAVRVDLQGGVYERQVARLNAEVRLLQERLAEAELLRERHGAEEVIEKIINFAGMVESAPARVQRDVIASVFERLEADREVIKEGDTTRMVSPFLASGEGS
jgi:uncharacterized protein YfcZ (UPF0381/DUF406 family)